MAQASAWWKFSPFLSYGGLYQQRLGAAVCEWRLFHPPPDSFNSSRMSVILGKVSREERRKPLNPAELLRARPLTNDFPHEGSRTADRWEPGIKRKGLILKVLVSNLRGEVSEEGERPQVIYLLTLAHIWYCIRSQTDRRTHRTMWRDLYDLVIIIFTLKAFIYLYHMFNCNLVTF